jgi:hypothetical protein
MTRRRRRGARGILAGCYRDLIPQEHLDQLDVSETY